ncbi:dihydrofolate reductase family protein [Flindersiella endophytica]
MVELTADLFVSLDNFAGAVNGEAYFGFYGPDLERQIADTMSTPHAILMGRVTYEALAPMASDDDSGMNETPKFVLTNTLEEPPAWQNTRLIRGEPAEAVRALKQESELPLRTIGSLRLIRGLLEAGLVDRLKLTVFPIVLGDDGREPFSVGKARGGLELLDTKVLDNRLVVLEYRPAKAGQ